MSFVGRDEAERHLGTVVEEMSPFELVAYLKEAMWQGAGIDLRIDGAGTRERAVMTWLQKTYGREGAGHILKWVVHHHGGMAAGKPVGFFAFQRERKWWTDEMYAEAQAGIGEARARIATEAEARSNFITLDTWLRTS